MIESSIVLYVVCDWIALRGKLMHPDRRRQFDAIRRAKTINTNGPLTLSSL